MVKSTTTGTVTSSGRDGTAAAMAQNEQMAEEHSTLEQQPPGKLDHPAWCVMWMVQPASMLKHSKDADVNSIVQRFQLQESSALPTPLAFHYQHVQCVFMQLWKRSMLACLQSYLANKLICKSNTVTIHPQFILMTAVMIPTNTVCLEKNRNVYCNIFHKTPAILMKRINRDTVQVRSKMFVSFCSKFIQETVYQILSVSLEFYRRCYKNILVSFSWTQCRY